MTLERTFAAKIAGFNAIGILAATGGPTYIDARLSGHVAYGARHYSAGYWICLLAPAVFLLTYWAILRAKADYRKVIAPFGILIAAGLVALPNFRPEFLHPAVTLTVILYAVAGLLASWIHFAPRLRQEPLQDSAIPLAARIEWLKEGNTLWRTVSITLAAAYIAVLVPVSLGISNMAARITSVPSEQLLLNNASLGGFIVFSIYVVFGPVAEAVQRVRETAGLFLTVRN